MKMYSLQHSEDSLRIDREIYNAPLPWHGDVTLIRESYKRLFQNGFQANNESRSEATSSVKMVEKWIIKMERISIENGQTAEAPDIRTYEAVIQAWTKTGTEEGLLRAESWASRALEASLSDPFFCPRLATFSLIVSAWAQCGEEKGLDNVKK